MCVKSRVFEDFYKSFTEKYSKKLPTSEDYVAGLSAVRRLVDLWEFEFDQLQNQINLFVGGYQAWSYPTRKCCPVLLVSLDHSFA